MSRPKNTGQGRKRVPDSQIFWVKWKPLKTGKHYESTFGIGPFVGPIVVPMNKAVFMDRIVNTKIKTAFAKSGEVQIELIQPLDGDNPYTEFLARRGEGIHHLGFKVDDIDQAKAEFAKKGDGAVLLRRSGGHEVRILRHDGVRRAGTGTAVGADGKIEEVNHVRQRRTRTQAWHY